MHGKTVVVTGASSGIGLEVAEALARQGASLVMVSRDPVRGEAALQKLVACSSTKPRLLLADLSRQDDVRRLAAELLDSTPRVDVLINNAGAMYRDRDVTVDGIERTFALNHMAYFLLTNLLLARLAESGPARIVSVASRAHRGTINFDDLQSEHGYNGIRAYQQSKLANILFTRALARRVQGMNVTANCLHPGDVRSNFFKGVGGWVEMVSSITYPFIGISAAAGARTAVYLASSPEAGAISGEYFVKCEIAQPSREARDDRAAERLWQVSQELAGLA
jgi:NAD(P)-dependent dehydrogenase (short-subunit alcohol dehydrogenase family)